jgi:hypothetical protein
MTVNNNLSAMTIRLEAAVAEALAAAAQRKGQEVADFATDILTEHVIKSGDLRKIDPSAEKRLTAEIEVTARAIAFARELTKRSFYPDVTLRVFQEIKANDELRTLYLRAIGGRSGDERGNAIKARINRSLGASIKTAVGARTVKSAGGEAKKVQVFGEFIFSYSELAPA